MAAKRTLAGELAVKPSAPAQAEPATVPESVKTKRDTPEDRGIRATTIKLPTAALSALKALAVEKRVPVNSLLIEAVDNYLRLHGRKTAA